MNDDKLLGRNLLSKKILVEIFAASVITEDKLE